MDENKIPEQEDSWLDDVLGPESAGAELGPDASVLFNTHLTDPGAPAEEMSDFYEEFPEDLPIADILPIPDGQPIQSDIDMSSTQLLMTAVDAIIASDPVPEEVPEIEPMEETPDPSATMVFQAPEVPAPNRYEKFRNVFEEDFGDDESDESYDDVPILTDPPKQPKPRAEEPQEEITEEPPMKKGRPKRKKGYGLLGIPHILVTLVWLAIIAFIGVSLGRMAWLCVSDVLAFGQIPREATIVITEEENRGVVEIASTNKEDLEAANYIMLSPVTGEGQKFYDLIRYVIKKGVQFMYFGYDKYQSKDPINTLKAYFQGKKELFKELAIDALEKEWAEYPVFHIDFNGTNFTQGDALFQKIEGYIASCEREYGKDPVRMTSGDRFAYVLKQAHKKYGRRPASVVSHRSEFFFRNRYCK